MRATSGQNTPGRAIVSCSHARRRRAPGDAFMLDEVPIAPDKEERLLAWRSFYVRVRAASAHGASSRRLEQRPGLGAHPIARAAVRRTDGLPRALPQLQ